MEALKQTFSSGFRFVASQLPGLVAAALTVITLFVTGHIDWGNKVAEARLNDYHQIRAEVEEANSLIDRFTRSLVNSGDVDMELIDSLAENLGVQYSRISEFEVILPPASRAVAEDYRAALNRLKYGIVTVDSMADLEFVGADIANMYRAQLSLVPLLAKASGITAGVDLDNPAT